MDESDSTIIPSAMRPSKSLIDQVKSTLSDLVSSVFKKTNVVKESMDESSDVEDSLQEQTDEVEVRKDSLYETGTSDIDTNKSVSSSPASKSRLLRSKEAYKKRLKSYILSLWCGKPLSLSPPLLAQYGWECVGENMAKCCICGSAIAIHLPWPNSPNYRNACNEAQQKIIKGHKKVCSWPTNPVNNIYLNPFHEDYLSLDDKNRLKKDFVERARRLYCLKKELPHITLEILSDLGLDDDSITKLNHVCVFPPPTYPDSEEGNISEHAFHLSSLSLALCGWDADPNAQLPSLFCEDTGRIVGLWNFYSVSPESESSLILSNKRRRLDDGSSSGLTIEKSWFHPVSQHHVWSPWIVSLNPISTLLDDPSAGSVKSEVKPGWKVVRDILLNDQTNQTNGASASPSQNPTKTPPRVAVLQAKRMLADWSSP